MPYRLTRLTGENESSFIGEYETYTAALRARMNDVLDALDANNGWWLRVEHVIVGPGLLGATTEHPFCTELGVDPACGTLPTRVDLDEARRWLDALHRG